MAKISDVTPASEPVTRAIEGYMPEINTIGIPDLVSALRAGFHDFVRAPVYGLIIGSVYVLGGLFFYFSLTAAGNVWMIVPLAVGFPLIGPFIAVGFYEISKRKMAGEDYAWRDIFIAILSRREAQISYVGIAILCISWVWVFIARILFAIFLGSTSFSSVSGFLLTALTTEAGWGFLAVGSAMGGIMAYVLYSSTVVSLPLLIGRDIDVVSAIITSFRAVARNRFVMLVWAAIIIGLLAIAMLPFFLGLIVVLPVLGHATWHLFTKVVVQEQAA